MDGLEEAIRAKIRWLERAIRKIDGEILCWSLGLLVTVIFWVLILTT